MVSYSGWTWDYVRDCLDLPTLHALHGVWRKHPPAHLLIASFLGHKPPADDPAQDNEEALRMLMSMVQAQKQPQG